MSDLIAQKIILAPGAVYYRAKKLASAGRHLEALELLDNNKLEVEIYNDHVEMKISRDWHNGLKAPRTGKNDRNYFKSPKNWKKRIK